MADRCREDAHMTHVVHVATPGLSHVRDKNTICNYMRALFRACLMCLLHWLLIYLHFSISVITDPSIFEIARR